MAAMLPVFQAIGTVVSVISALSQGSSASAAANYNAQVNAQNAVIARQQAEAQARQIERENYLRLGAIRANQGASGGAGDEGSVLDVLGDVAAQGELERQQALYQGELKARGYTNSATLDRYSASTASTSGYLKAGSELLGGGIRTYDAFERLKRA